jgi:predicted RNA-binding Zn-ribbon protein involved in translation (DUF1610 family)
MSVQGWLPSSPGSGEKIEWQCPHCRQYNHTPEGKGKARLGAGGAAAASGAMCLLMGPLGLLVGPLAAGALAVLEDSKYACDNCGKVSTLKLARKPPSPRPQRFR